MGISAMSTRQRRSGHAPASEVDVLVRRLSSVIVGGEYMPGALLRERTLAARLGAAMDPLRQAIRVLESQRLLERQPGDGLRVADPSVDDVAMLLALREPLEGMAAREAAIRIADQELEGLRRIAERMEAADRSGPAERLSMVYEAPEEYDFHHRVAMASGNRWVQQLLCRDLYAQLRLLRFRACPVRSAPQRDYAQHWAIFDRIQARDPEGAERLMREHVRDGGAVLLAHLREHGTQPA